VTSRSSEAFLVRGWSWSGATGDLRCHFSQGSVDFTETFTFPSAGVPSQPSEQLARAFDLLTVTAGVSYYKTAAAERVVLDGLADHPAWVPYVQTLYDEGLREFAVVNDLPVPFVPATEVGTPRPELPASGGAATTSRPVVPMGGGRDSLLVAFALRSLHPVLLTVKPNHIVDRQAALLDTEAITIGRVLDPGLGELNRTGALNGHIPVTAINSCVAIVAALLQGSPQVAMSNERSANEPTRQLHGVPINHQYSKSSHCEQLLRDTLAALQIDIDYFSALRPYGELAISRAIGRHLHALPPFLSCNRAFVFSAADRSPSWCGECAKCRFVFLGLAPFVDRIDLVGIFGRDLLAGDDDIAQLAAMLTGPQRAFDCIGTDDEIAAALHLAADGQWHDSPALASLCATIPRVSPDQLSALLQPDDNLADHTPAALRNLVRAVLT
jgi:hypothetical protein